MAKAEPVTIERSRPRNPDPDSEKGDPQNIESTAPEDQGRRNFEDRTLSPIPKSTVNVTVLAAQIDQQRKQLGEVTQALAVLSRRYEVVEHELARIKPVTGPTLPKEIVEGLSMADVYNCLLNASFQTVFSGANVLNAVKKMGEDRPGGQLISTYVNAALKIADEGLRQIATRCNREDGPARSRPNESNIVPLDRK